jgi:hypothetical protein
MAQGKPTLNPSFTVMMLLAAVSSFITAYLVIDGRYIPIGYQQSPAGTAYAGMEVWDLHHVFIVLTVTIYLVAIICLFWPKLFGKMLSLPKSLGLLLGLLFMVFTFFPKPFEFQVRHYQSLSDGTYILLSQGSADFVDGNEGFTGSIQQETIEDFYNKDGELRQFKCVTNDAWWWGKLTVKHHFYPILDETNHLKLLESRCQEITHD